MKKLFLMMALLTGTLVADARTLIVYYSYTNNVERIVNELRTQIDADVVEIEPAEKGLDYAANNYAIGSAQIAAIRNNPGDAASYPPIDPVNVNLRTAVVEQHGRTVADLPLSTWQGHGWQEHRTYRVEREQRHKRR